MLGSVVAEVRASDRDALDVIVTRIEHLQASTWADNAFDVHSQACNRSGTLPGMAGHSGYFEENQEFTEKYREGRDWREPDMRMRLVLAGLLAIGIASCGSPGTSPPIGGSSQ